MKRPWEKDLTDKATTWDAYVAWELWVKRHMVPDAGQAFDDAGDTDAWKESLYAICCGLLDGDYKR